jgi:hypothetical protein
MHVGGSNMARRNKKGIHKKTRQELIADYGQSDAESVARRGAPILFLAFLICALLFGYVMVWVQASSRIKETMTEILDGYAKADFQVEYSDIDVGGFPMPPEATLDVRIVSPDYMAEWSLDMKNVRVISEMFANSATVYFDDGLRLKAKNNGAVVDLKLDTNDLSVVFEDVKDTFIHSTRIRGSDLRITGVGLGGTLQIGHVWAKVAHVGDPKPQGGGLSEKKKDNRPLRMRHIPSRDVVFDLKDIRLPSAMDTPLGRVINDLSFKGRVLHNAQGYRLTESLDNWRNKGGQISVSSLRLDWPPLRLKAEGMMGLDADLQPVASLTAYIAESMHAVERMRESGFVDRKEASLVTVLAKDNYTINTNGEQILTTSMMVQGRTLYVGPVPVLTLPALDWGTPPEQRAIRPGFDIGKDGEVIDLWKTK